MQILQEPFTGLRNRHGKPMLDGTPDLLRDLLRPVGAARPCREKIGNLVHVDVDDLIWVLPPGREAPTLSPTLLAKLVDTVDRGARSYSGPPILSRSLPCAAPSSHWSAPAWREAERRAG